MVLQLTSAKPKGLAQTKLLADTTWGETDMNEGLKGNFRAGAALLALAIAPFSTSAFAQEAGEGNVVAQDEEILVTGTDVLP